MVDDLGVLSDELSPDHLHSLNHLERDGLNLVGRESEAVLPLISEFDHVTVLHAEDAIAEVLAGSRGWVCVLQLSTRKDMFECNLLTFIRICQGRET